METQADRLEGWEAGKLGRWKAVSHVYQYSPCDLSGQAGMITDVSLPQYLPASQLPSLPAYLPESLLLYQVNWRLLPYSNLWIVFVLTCVRQYNTLIPLNYHTICDAVPVMMNFMILKTKIFFWWWHWSLTGNGMPSG